MEIKVEINGKTVSVREGTTVMEAAQKINIFIPHFCYHEKLSIAANCRMCMVDIEKAPKAMPACATPVVDGMVVYTDTERARKAQHGVMEFLLINHPLDCPICDQGGECPLQDLAVGYGISRSRYQEEKRVVFEKNLGPLVSTSMTRCIHCTRCVRFGVEVAGIMEMGMIGRGEHAEIMPFIEKTIDSELSGNIIDLCPVGALTSKPFRFSARAWELTNHATVAVHDSWGSHIVVQTKDQQVKRVLPDHSPSIHEHWISDRDRFSYEGLAVADRIHWPMARKTGGKAFVELPWKDALRDSADKLQKIIRQHGADKVGFFVSPRAGNEEALLIKRIADHLGCANVDSRLQQRHFDGEDISGLGIEASSLKRMKNVVFIGAEPTRELPLLAAYLRQKKRKKKVLSIAAKDLSRLLPLTEQAIVPPTQISRLLENLLVQMGIPLPDNYKTSKKDLFNAAAETPWPIQNIAKLLAKNGEQTVIWLGDSALSAPDYGVIAALARQLAAHLGAAVGTLADGGNGAGVRAAGALPADGGLNTAQMLRADLKAAVLFRCEPEDFAETALAKQMLQKAEFTCAITTHGSGINQYADMLLPAAEFCETDASYINGYGETTRTQAAAPPPGKARPGWKILRVLGEYLSAPGFDFNDLATVQNTLQSDDAPAQPIPTRPQPLQQVEMNSESDAYCLYGGMPAYGSDILLRRAAALQKTRQSKRAHIACMNPQDMEALQLKEDSRIVITDGDGNEETTTVAADKQLARGVVQFYPVRLISPHSLTIRIAEEKKTA